MLAPHVGSLALHEPVPGLSLPRQSGRVSRSNAPPAWQQPLMVAVILGMTYFLALIGLGQVARYFFTLCAFVSCGYYVRRYPWHYVTLTFWFWTITPLARRLIDLQAGFDTASFLLGTPNLVAIFMLRSILNSRDLLRLRESAVGLFLLLPLLFGLSVSFVSGDVIPALLSGAAWIAPLFYYYFFLANWRRIGEAEAPFREFITLNTVVMAAYGLLQFVSPQPWDVFWVRNSGMVVIGPPEPYVIRVFGTLNSPGHMAVWLATLILLALHFRTKLVVIAIPTAAVALLLTFVRSAAGSVVLGLVVAICMGRQGIFKILAMVLLFGVLSAAGLSVLSPEVTDHVVARIDTVGDLGHDGSANAREAIYASGPELMDKFPFGTGLGGAGYGTVGSVPIVFDAGPIEVFVALGWVGGAIYLTGFVLLMIQALIAARVSRSSAALAFAVAVVANSSLMVFTNVGGFFAATLWTCAAYAATLGIAARKQPKIMITAHA